MHISDLDFTIEFSNIKTNDQYVFITMFTDDYYSYAKRFENSLTKFNLPHLIFRTPSVHSSISSRGKDNSFYTKSNIIKYTMEKTGKSVIFIDCDCEIKDTPYLLINSLDKYDFAIFNWLSGEGNQTYLPYTPPELSTTYYKPGHSIEFLSKDQLICSGAVQYWSNNTESIALLNFWQTTISNNLGVADDHCLDYAFNNLAGHKVRALWLPKSYARYAWWIFDQPIIDHPQMPSTSLHENNLMNRIYDSNLTATKSADLKGNILIDPSRSRIFTFENDDIVKVEDIAATFYI